MWHTVALNKIPVKYSISISIRKSTSAVEATVSFRWVTELNSGGTHGMSFHIRVLGEKFAKCEKYLCADFNSLYSDAYAEHTAREWRIVRMRMENEE
jgi:hypothetical protein